MVIHNLITLNNKTAKFFQNLTNSKYRQFLNMLDSKESMIAVGAYLGSQPVGLVLAQISTSYSQDRKIAQILSLFVIPEYRENGIGTSLLNNIENELNQLGCFQVYVVYESNSSTRYWEKILHKSKWSTPRIRMLLCSGLIANIKDAAWLKHANILPPAYTIFPWVELTKQERELIEKQQATSAWYPEILSPWSEEEIIEPMNSLGLRYNDQIVGWMITHRIAEDTIRYTKMFVREDIQRLGRAIPLLAKAIKLQLDAREDSKAVFAVLAENTEMAKFVDKRLSSYLNSIGQSWESLKVFM